MPTDLLAPLRPAPAVRSELVRLLDAGAIHCAYQPIAELATGATVAFEALARGPVGSTLHRPDALFAAAADHGLTRRLDWACQQAALTGALQARLGPEPLLFVNVEPATLGDRPPAALARLLDASRGRLRLVLELSERSVLARPTDLLGLARWARAQGWGVAVDDVGVNPESVALMPFVEPDIIKLDLRVVQDRPTAATGRLLNAVLAQAERSGSLILAEGIETEDHLDRARSLGARLGQGWRFGRPGPLPSPPSTPMASGAPARHPVELPIRGDRAAFPSPFELARRHLDVRPGRTDLLLAISRDFEHQARVLADDAPVVLSAFQSAERFTPATARLYRELAHTSALVGALGRDLPAEPAPGVRGGTLAADDPLLEEWTVVVLSPHVAGALIARDTGAHGPGGRGPGRSFDYAVTHDRRIATAAACSLLARLAPVEPHR